MTKPKIFFIPTYIGPLKHYARLIPYLEDKYEVGFLFVYKDSPRRQEAIDYCKENNYIFYIIDEGLNEDKRISIPFFTPLKKRYEHSMACREFLENIRPVKIISHKSSSPYDTIFKEANKKGVETIVLQWSSDAGLLEREDRQCSLVRRIYLFVLRVLSGVLDVFYKEPRYGYGLAIPKKVGIFYEEKAPYYLKNGCDSGSVCIVGSPDLQLLHELKQKINLNSLLKDELLRKYGLEKNKLKIMVILHRFYLTADSKYRMTMEEQVAHYYDLFEIIREVFSEDEAEIILKTHPTEIQIYNMYKPYANLGVKIYSGEARTDELVCLSDLYIGEPASSVNYMAVGSGIQAIFVNFSQLKIINERGKYFFIKQVVGEKGEFIEKLKEFKAGKFENMYDKTKANLRSIDKTIELINK